MKQSYRFIVSLLGLFLWPISAHSQVTGASVPEQSVSVVLHVNNRSPQASDANPGTVDLPLKTLSKAAELAWIKNRRNVGVKVSIAPGTFREMVDVWQETDAPIVFEAQQMGTVAIAGSDVWTGWKQQGTSNIYTHAWPYDWALSDVPSDWRSDAVAAKAFTPIVRKREMIVVAGKFLKQVLSYAELSAGSFYADDTKDTVYMQPPVGLVVTPTTITEVAVRPVVLKALQKKNLVLRGIIFKHANSPFNTSAVEIGSSANVLIEDCQFIWNNAGGLSLGNSQQVTVRRSRADFNGSTGMGAAFGKNFLFEETQTSYNNWRGVMGDYTGWSVAGLKHLFIHGAEYRRHKAEKNHAPGFWLDSDSTDIVVDGAFFHDNLIFGTFIEANQGPIAVRNSIVCHNRGPGFLINNSKRVTLESNVIYANKRAQILMEGSPIEGRPMKNWESGEQMTLLSEQGTFRDNDIVANTVGQLLIELNLGGASSQSWKAFMQSLTVGKNIWHHPASPKPFRVFGWSAEVTNLDFNEWRTLTGQELDSVFTNPQFRSPDGHHF